MNPSGILDKNLATVSQPVRLVGLGKFVGLNIFSFGLYSFWWIYQVWRFFGNRNESKGISLMKAILASLFTFPLMEYILNFAKSRGYKSSYSSSALYLLFVGFMFSPYLAPSFFLLSRLFFLCLIPPLLAYNYAVMDAGLEKETKGFNALEWVIFIVGGLFYLLLIVGMML